MIWGLLALAVIALIVLAQVKAAGKTAEIVKRQNDDLEAAARIGQVVADRPTDKRSLVDRLRDQSGKL